MPTVRISVAAKTDLTTKSFATRRMFARIRRPSSTPRGIAPKSSETSTMSETPFAIWRAGAERDATRAAFMRRHVVDAVADHRHVAALAHEASTSACF